MKKFFALMLAGMMLMSTTVMATEADTGATEGIQSDAEFYAKADLSVLEGKKLGITIQDLMDACEEGKPSKEFIAESLKREGERLLSK